MAPRSVKSADSSREEIPGPRTRRWRRIPFVLGAAATSFLAVSGIGPLPSARHTRVVTSRPAAAPIERAGGIAPILTAADVMAVINDGGGGARRRHAGGRRRRSHRHDPGRLSPARRRRPPLPTSRSRWPAPPAYFSNDQAPLSSRTVRFISGIHFPPGRRRTRRTPRSTASRTSTAAATSTRRATRSSTRRSTDPGRSRARSGRRGRRPLPCRASDTRGCAVAARCRRRRPADHSVGITTGKIDLRRQRPTAPRRRSTAAGSSSFAAARSSAASASRASPPTARSTPP